MRKNNFITATLILLVILIGCTPSFVTDLNKEKFKTPLYTADNNYSLTATQILEALNNSRYLLEGGVMDTAQIRAFADSILVDTLLGFDAREVNLDEYYNNRKLFRLQYYRFLIDTYFQVNVQDKIDVDSLNIVEYYNNRVEQFTVEEQVDALVIFLSADGVKSGADSARFANLEGDDFDAAMKIYLDEIRASITTPEEFQEAVIKYSEDIASRDRNGSLGWIRRNYYRPPFDTIAFALEEGEISDPYANIDGYHIIMVKEKMAAGPIPLDSQVFNIALERYRAEESNRIGNELVDSLFPLINMEYNEELMDKDLFKVDGEEWVAVVNGIDTIDCNESRKSELTYRKEFDILVTTPEIKKEMLKLIGQKYVVIQAARNSGLADTPLVKNKRDSLYHLMQKLSIKKDVYNRTWTPSDSAVKKYYRENSQEFTFEKPLKVMHIVAEDSISAEFLRDQVLSGYNFLELANEYYPGDKSIREELANLGYIGENDVTPEFYAAAAQLLPGDVSPPVKTQYGYHIIKLTERKQNKDIDQARSMILKALRKNHSKMIFEDYRDQAFLKYHVKSPEKLKEFHLKSFGDRSK